MERSGRELCLILTFEGAVEPGITWYEVLGALPRAPAREIRLTGHPMPVDGLVVGQSRGPLAKARTASALTVQV